MHVDAEFFFLLIHQRAYRWLLSGDVSCGQSFPRISSSRDVDVRVDTET